MVYLWLIEGLQALRGVEPHEVLQALTSPQRLPAAAVSGGIRVIVISARTHAGRPLIVAVRPAGGLDHLIIGARDMTPAELARFEQWEAMSDD